MNINELLLSIFPIALLTIFIWNDRKPEKRGGFFDTPLEINNTVAIKGFAAVGIILHHLTQKITEYGNVMKGPVTLFNWMGILFTSIFFFFSGYGLVVSCEKKEGYIDGFLKKRMPNVLIPFYMSNIVYYLVFGVYYAEVDNGLDVALSLAGIRLLNTNTWFIVEIIILYLAFYFAEKKTKSTDRTINIMLFVTLAMVIISMLLCHDNHDGAARNPFQGEWWYNTTFLFWLGMKYADKEESVRKWAEKAYKWLLPLVSVGFVLVYAGSILVMENIGYYQEWEGHPGYGAKLVTLLIQCLACCIFVAMLVLICMKRQFGNKVVDFLGSISLELYIIHDMVKRILVEDKRDGNDFVFYLAVLVISIVLAWLLKAADDTLIALWKRRKAYFAYEPETYEGRERLNRQKKIYKICWMTVYILMVIILIFAAIDIYGRTVTPKLEFEEEKAALAQAEVGDIVYFGKYETDYLNDVKESVPWIVLDRQDDKVLLVTKEVIEAYYYTDKFADSNWMVSKVREASEEYLIPELFSRYEKKLLCTTILESICRDGSIVRTDDRIFLLSVDEAERYFSTASDRKCLPTLTMGRNINDINEKDKGKWWWLRDFSSEEKKACIVDINGEIREDGEYANIITGGIRPAVWVTVD